MRIWSLLTLTAAVILTGSSAAWAGSFTIQPTRVELSPRRPNLSVQITNMAEEPVTVQAHLVAWTADGEEEVQVDTDALILNPPIFTLAPHKTQFMRVGLRKPQFGQTEVTYRLILEELPPAVGTFSGIRTLLRLSVPIFVAGSGVEPRTEWSAIRQNGKITLRASNRGTAHLQVRQLRLRTGTAAEPAAVQSVSSYLLPTGWKEWTFEEGTLSGADVLTLDALTDGKEIHETLKLQTR